MLDESTSLKASEKDEIRKAAKKFINKIEGFGAETHIVAFSQNAREITDLDKYGKWYNPITGASGMSTNYLGALMKAEDFLSASDENYIVFMSDGGPTANQWPEEKYPDEVDTGFKILDIVTNFFIGALEFVTNQLENTAALIIGGWYECLWVSEDEYVGNSLLTDITFLDVAGINNFWNKIFEEIGIKSFESEYSNDYVKAVWQLKWDALEDTFLESKWTYSVMGIMPKVHDLKSLDTFKASALEESEEVYFDEEKNKDQDYTQSQIYTIFYEPRSVFQGIEDIADRLETTADNDNARFYGLQRIATGGVATEKNGEVKVHSEGDYGYKEGRQYSFRCKSKEYYEESEENIESVLMQIANDIANTAVEEGELKSENGIIALESPYIADIMIGSDKLSENDEVLLNTIKSDLIENEGKLDLNKDEYEKLRTPETITFVY